MINKYIRSLGVEIELIVLEDEFLKLTSYVEDNKRMSWTTDGSICVDDDLNGLYVPLEIRIWDYSLNKLLRKVKTIFLHDVYQNKTCGNHVHLCFYNVSDSYIFSYSYFWNLFKKEYEIVFKGQKKFLDRLNNQYCYSGYDTKVLKYQTYEGLGDRYRMINFNALRRHGTVEIRILPYVDSFNEYKENLIKLLKIVKKCIIQSKNISSLGLYSESSYCDKDYYSQNWDIEKDRLKNYVFDVHKDILKAGGV